MKRGAIIFAVLSVLLFADGIYLQVGHNNQGCGCQGDTGTLFGGSTSIFLSEGTEVLIGAGFLLLVAVIMWTLAILRTRPASARGQVGEAQASEAQTKVTAGQGQPRKESGDQH